MSEQQDISVESIAAAERLAGLDFTDEERALMLDGVRKFRDYYAQLRTVVAGSS